MTNAEAPRLEDTPALILAGGLGTRLREAVPDRPKGLAPIGGRTFLDIQLELLREAGLRRFVLCIGYLAEQITSRYGDGSRLGVRIDYSIEDPGDLRGTGGALKLAERFIAPYGLVMNGDTYFDIDYARLLERHVRVHRPRGAVATLALACAQDAARFGSIEVVPESGDVRRFREKAPECPGQPGTVNGGVYVMERRLLDGVAAGRSFSLERDIFPAALAAGQILATEAHSEPFYDIGTPRALKEFIDRHERKKNQRLIEPGSRDHLGGHLQH